MRILVRASNWVGDAVMSLPALGAVRRRFPDAHIGVLARPWVAGLYRRESFAGEIIVYDPGKGAGSVQKRLQTAQKLREKRFQSALLLQNAFDAALLAWLADIPERIGYARDLRSPLLTRAIPVPRKGAIPLHESFYYLELLRRAGWLDTLPEHPLIRLEGATAARAAGLARFQEEGISTPIVAVSPGAAYGNAKRWLPERFVESAAVVALRLNATVALFGSAAERDVCDWIASQLASRGVSVRSYAGATTLEEFIDRAAACALFLTNDSGAMHIASALGVPTVAVFGATNHIATGPTGPLARVVRRDVECSPCLLRECPIDHRCMKAVSAADVADAALELLQLKLSGLTP